MVTVNTQGNAMKEEQGSGKAPGAVSVESLLRRALIFLEDGEWSNAITYCEKALDMEPENATAYWTEILATHTCKSTKELVLCGIPLDGDRNYEKAIKYGTEKEREFYRVVAELVKLGTITRFITCVRDGDDFLAKIWKNRYVAVCNANDAMKEFLSGILKGMEDIRVLPKNVLYLRKEFDDRLQTIAACDEELMRLLQDKFTQEIKSLYKFSMEQIQALVLKEKVYWVDHSCDNMVTEELVNSVIVGLEQQTDNSKKSPAQKLIKSKGRKKGRGITSASKKEIAVTCSVEELADVWADPTNDFRKGHPVPTGIDIGLDGYGSDCAMRYIALANKIFEKEGLSARATEVRLVERARQGAADNSTIQNECFKVYDAMCTSPKATLSDIQYLSDQCPDIPWLAWKYMEIVTNQFTRTSDYDYATDKTYDNLMSISTNRLLVRDARKKMQSLENELLALSEEEQARKNSEQKYVERALAGNDKDAQSYRKQWDTYLDMVSEEFEKTRSMIRNRIQELEKKSEATFQNGQTVFKITGIINACISIIILAVMVIICLKGKKYVDTPSLILQYRNFWFHVATILGSLGIGAIAFFVLAMIAGSISGIANKKDPYRGQEKEIYKEPLACRIINTATPILLVLLTIALAGMFVYSAITFPKKIGTISIKNVDDMQYIKNYPKGKFVLESDIDYEGKEIIKVGTFKGEFDGQQHTISNFEAKYDCFIKKNKGKISNFAITNATLSDALIHKNSGSVENVALKNINIKNEKETSPSNSAMFANINGNKAEIKNCIITESTFHFNYSKKLTGSCNIGGFVASNDGSIVASSISADIQGKVTLTEETDMLNIGSFVGHDDYNYEIAGCASTANFAIEITDKVQDEDSLFGGSPRCNIRIGGLLGYGTTSQSYFSGNLAVNYLYGDEDKIRTMDLDEWYYIGGLIGYGSAENCYATGSLTTSFAKNPNDPATLITCVGSLLGDSGKVNNCYVNMNFNLALFEGTHNGAPMIGNGPSYSSSEPNIVNSFIYPAQNATSIYQMRNTVNSKVENSYYPAGCGYSNIWWFNDGVETAAGNLKSAAFITGTLGWDANIWNIVDGQLPTLKPYVPTVETEATVE